MTDESRVRYCPDCGHISQIKADRFTVCCPDSHAVALPVAEAELLRTFFRARYLPEVHNEPKRAFGVSHREVLIQWQNAAVYWQRQSEERRKQLNMLEEELYKLLNNDSDSKTKNDVLGRMQVLLHRYNED